MAAIGAKYKWNNGRILHASRLWKSPTKRRLPRILIEDRAQEVGIKMYLEEPWMVFEETKESTSTISSEGSIPMEFYLNRYYLVPAEINGQDTYQWLKDKNNALLIWAQGIRYFVKPIKS